MSGAEDVQMTECNIRLLLWLDTYIRLTRRNGCEWSTKQRTLCWWLRCGITFCPLVLFCESISSLLLPVCLSKCNILIIVFVLGFAGTDTIVTSKCYCQIFLQFIDMSPCTCPSKQFLWGGGKFIVLLVANKCHPLTPNCSELDMFGVCRNTLSLKCSGRWCRHWTQICNGSFSSECAPRLSCIRVRMILPMISVSFVLQWYLKFTVLFPVWNLQGKVLNWTLDVLRGCLQVCYRMLSRTITWVQIPWTTILYTKVRVGDLCTV